MKSALLTLSLLTAIAAAPIAVAEPLLGVSGDCDEADVSVACRYEATDDDVCLNLPSGEIGECTYGVFFCTVYHDGVCEDGHATQLGTTYAWACPLLLGCPVMSPGEFCETLERTYMC